MRGANAFPYTEMPGGQRNDLANLRALLPYLWAYRGRVLLALSALVLAKVANVGVPVVLKEIVDNFTIEATLMAIPVALLLAYGALRLASSFFNELRDILFARVRYHAMRTLTARTLNHLHTLSLRYHLERKTGAISRDLQRGAASLSTMLNYMVFSILPKEATKASSHMMKAPSNSLQSITIAAGKRAHGHKAKMRLACSLEEMVSSADVSKARSICA